MNELLLFYISDELSIPIFWGVSLLVFALLLLGIFFQHRTGTRLKHELAELDKVRQDNIEYEFILKAMRIAVWHIDPVMRTLTVDADFRDVGGNRSTAQNTPLDTIEPFYEKNDRVRVSRALDDICSGRTNYYHEQYRVTQDASGTLYWEESFATISVRDETGRPSKIVGTSLRIDDQKQLEANLINARNKAEESDRLKTAFLANMGHEIRTPLNAIVGFADLLPVVENEADRNQLIAEIQANNHKLLNIIDGLVSMSKIEAEAKSLVIAQTDIVPMLKEMADNYAQLVDPSQVVLATDFPYGEMLMLTDISKLMEIVDGFMSNAIKFTKTGSIMLGYNLTDGDHIRIWVKDTGIGIAPEDQERVFERFVKIDEYVPGTGLGLSVAKSHAESLGGTIGLESTLGKGSVFWVELPLA